MKVRLQRFILLRMAILALVVGGVCRSGVCQAWAVISSYHDGKRYDFRLTYEELAKTPAWHDDEPNPPLPVRQAKLVGTEYLKQLFVEADKWNLTSITLMPVADRWVYKIAFTAPPPLPCMDCLTSPFELVVTMDGVALKATVSTWNSPYPR